MQALHEHIRQLFRLYLGSAALVLVLASCSVAGRSSSLNGATPKPPQPQALASSTPTPAVFQTSDDPGDCFSGVSHDQVDCAGLDMTGMVIGPPSSLPSFVDESALNKRFDVVVTFADDLKGQEAFGLCLMMNLDQDPSTGVNLSPYSGFAGIDRGFCVDVPDGTAYTYDYSQGNEFPKPVYGDDLVTAQVSGNQVVLAINPSLLSNHPDAAPNGFDVFVESARGTDPLDFFNGRGPIDQAQAISVPEDVIAQVFEK